MTDPTLTDPLRPPETDAEPDPTTTRAGWLAVVAVIALAVLAAIYRIGGPK